MPKKILTKADVIEIKQAIARGERLNKIAKRYGVAANTVSDIKLEKSWKKVKIDQIS